MKDLSGRKLFSIVKQTAIRARQCWSGLYLCVVIIFFEKRNWLVFWIWIKLEIGSDLVENSDCRRWQSIWFRFTGLFLILSDFAFEFEYPAFTFQARNLAHFAEDIPDFACKSIGRYYIRGNIHFYMWFCCISLPMMPVSLSSFSSSMVCVCVCVRVCVYFSRW